MNAKLIATICHEADRAYCRALGADAPQAWVSTPEFKRKETFAAVCAVVADPDSTPRTVHEAWVAQKLEDGWEFGPTNDEEAKTHPLMVPYSELNEAQRVEDELFTAIVRALAPQKEAASV